MSYFKKFTDFLCGLGLFFGFLQIIGKFMIFDFGEEAPDAITEKIKIFIDDKSDDIKHYLLLFGFLALSLFISRCLSKLPYLVFFASTLPFYQAINMLIGKNFFEKPMLFVVITAFGVVGAIYDLLFLDREHSRRHAFFSAGIFGAIYSILLLIVEAVSKKYNFEGEYSKLGDAELSLVDEYEVFGFDLLSSPSEEQIKFMHLLIVITVISVLLGFILREAYFVDLFGALIMLVLIFIKWHNDVITFAPAAVCIPVLLYFALRLCIFLFEPCKEEVQST